MAKISTGSVASAVKSTFSHTIKLVQNDTRPELRFTITDDATGGPLDLSSTSNIVLKLRALNTSEVKATIPIVRVTPSEGTVFLQWRDGDLDTAGVFTGEIEISYLDSTTHTLFQELKFEVRGDY